MVFSADTSPILVKQTDWCYILGSPKTNQFWLGEPIFLLKFWVKRMKSNIKTVCGLEKYEELSKRKWFLNQLRFYWFVLIASLKDIGKEETIKEE